MISSFQFFRYGWIPSPDDVESSIGEKYDWVQDASITFMEILHAAYRCVGNSFTLSLFYMWKCHNKTIRGKKNDSTSRETRDKYIHVNMSIVACWNICIVFTDTTTPMPFSLYEIVILLRICPRHIERNLKILIHSARNTCRYYNAYQLLIHMGNGWWIVNYLVLSVLCSKFIGNVHLIIVLEREVETICSW